LGELEQNPYLQDNDVVVISAIDKFVTSAEGLTCLVIWSSFPATSLKTSFSFPWASVSTLIQPS
jgi:hypothetical protein